jgi:osmotically-inducible protein OsmY
MLEKHAGASADIINAIDIKNDNGYVTLSGNVESEQMRMDVVNRVRSLPSVKGVRDELKVDTSATKHQPQAGQPGPGGTVRVEAVRAQMLKEVPSAQAVIRALVITEDGNLIVIRGLIPDQATHDALMKAAKDTPGVKDTKDDTNVAKKAK